MPRLTRRRLLAVAGRVLPCAALLTAVSPFRAWSQATAGNGSPDADTMTRLVQDLFPHDELDRAFYAGVAEAVTRQLADEEAALAAFAGELDDRAGSVPWRRLDSGGRTRILTAMEQKPFFIRLWETTSDILYLQPEVFPLIGYGGNALARGGYLHEDFGRVGWLEAYK